MTMRSIAVDDEARIILRYERRVEHRGQVSRNTGRADIPRDMPPALDLIESERTQAVRHPLCGMVAREEHRRAPVRADDAHRGGFVRAEQRVAHDGLPSVCSSA